MKATRTDASRETWRKDFERHSCALVGPWSGVSGPSAQKRCVSENTMNYLRMFVSAFMY